MRSSALCVLLLQAALAATSNARVQSGDKKDDTAAPHDPTQNDIEVKTDIVAEQLQHEVRQPGADLVDSALAHLRKLPPPLYRRKKQAPGIFGTIFRYIFVSIPIGPASAPSTSSGAAPLSGPLSTAVDLLGQAAQQDNSDALYILGDLNFFGNYSHPRDLQTAFNFYEQLASNHGNTTAQYMMGLYYSTGLGDVVPQDQAKALLYYTFAAIRGDSRAEMATGFRHLSGIGTTKSCEAGIKYYKRVADKAIDWYRSGPPGGMSWVHQGWRIADEDGGIYGEGASVSSSGMNAWKPSAHPDAHASISDMIEYLDLLSQKGDSMATYNLGKIYYEGQRGLDKDFALARKYFTLVTSRYWKKDGVVSSKSGIEKTACKAAGFLGRMYLRGDGMKQNFDRAKFWFKRGMKQGDAQSQYGMGLILINGLDGEKQNLKLAMELFAAAAGLEYAPARVQMGQLYLDQGGPEDIRLANNQFELAARHGSIEAYYYLAEMSYHGLGREKTCSQALSYYKSVAERAEPLVSSWGDANAAYESEVYDLAFLQYLMAAEQGYERAQTNVAYMLDTQRSKMSLTGWFRKNKHRSRLLTNPGLGLINWARSSRQSNIDSLVKVGDHYFYGIGAEPDYGKAVQCYTGASDYSQSAQALFNLGWMHENGVGLTQDFHLAKRYYDLALEVNDEAYLPVTLSLLKLRLRSAWNTLTHGPIHSIQDEPKNRKDRTVTEWINSFLEDDEIYDEYYVDEYYDDAVAEGDGVLEEGGIVESFLIIGITVCLVLLLWWRQRVQQQNAQPDANQRQNQGQGLGLGNAANNPGANAFPGWAAGGVGL